MTERDNLRQQIEKLKADNKQMQQMSMLPSNPALAASMPAAWGQTMGRGATMGGTMPPPWAMTAAMPNQSSPWGALGNGDQDPDEVLRGFSKKFREKEDKYKAVIEKLSRLNQELALTKSKNMMQIDTLSKEIRRIQQAVESKSKELEKAKILNHEHVARQKQMAKRHSEQVAHREKQAAAQMERNEKERANRRLQITKLMEDINIKSSSITELEGKLQGLVATEKEAVAAKEEMQKEMGAPNLKELQKKVRDLEEAELRTRVENEKLKTTNEALNQALNRAMHEKVELDNEIKSLTEKTTSQKEEVKKLRQEAKGLQTENETLTEKVGALEEEKRRMQKITRDLREKVMNTEEKLDDAKAQIAHYDGALQELKERYTTLDEANVKEQGSSAYFRQELEDTRSEKKRLEKEVVALKTGLNALTAENKQLEEKLKLSTDLDKLDFEKLNEIMTSSKRMAGALEVIRNHVRRGDEVSSSRLGESALMATAAAPVAAPVAESDDAKSS